jgi:hypothetical protein
MKITCATEVALVLAASLLSACAGTVAEDLPAGWMDARPMDVQQSACLGDARGGPPQLLLDKTADGLRGTYRNATFRCGQHLCGFVLDAREITRVLIQPCELHPQTAPTCDCLYDVTFALRARAGMTTVELFRRPDLYGAEAPVDATLVARGGVPH